MPLLWYYLWIAPHLLLIGIAGIMFRRHMIRQFPWFFAYTCYEVVEFVVLFTLSKGKFGYPLYFSVYSATKVVSTIFRFGIILEILRELTSSYVVLVRVLKPLFRWMGLTLIIAALALAVYAGGNRSDHFWFVANMVDRTMLILQTGLLLGLFLFSRYLTLSWRNSMFGIALGFGVYATAELIIAAISSQAGYWHRDLLNYLIMATYHCSTVIWAFYLFRQEPVRSHDLSAIPVQHEVEAWNEELERLLHQ